MSSKQWTVVIGGKDKGPYSTEEMISKLKAKELNPYFYAHSEGMTPMLINQIPDLQNWETSAVLVSTTTTPVTPMLSGSNNNQIQNNYTPAPATPSVSPAINQNSFSSQSTRPHNCHEIDFRITGEEMQFVEIELDPQETVVAEAGSMMYMTDSIEMNTIFGDGSQQADSQSLFGKFLSAGKRIITGESLFMTAFTNIGGAKQRVAFASPYPGKIIPVDLGLFNGKLICQKDAFLCSAKGVSIGIEFNKKLGVGLFGGEGFIMQKLEGDGLAFIHACGTISEIHLGPGERLKVDTGCLVAFSREINYDIEMVRGVKSMFFGGEGMFLATVQGPGTVWIQSLPFSRLATRVLAGATGRRKEEGSALGGLGNLLGGN